ncbi:M28 family peptidase [Schleiferia thermophila]|jgi:hypothetical protein|uniref:PDZ domain-containing protein n=1 Tax=Schleiferia thermophila TaxID=884107 RepID=A0A369A5X0_9FLAO|nr:M28 family peptidase [Schleiferia thermophila]KFD39647.1 peptidase M28 [Schleiferia thermophila str. Yellowstone]RCX03808.1 PDZ domain-containing protein [Schleiferia thermophila]GCD80040.1 hypothetical protein JCM30197_12870 [Schleiferia thermophila]
MNAKTTFFAILQFYVFFTFGQNCVSPELISVEWIEYLVNELASERMQGRYPGTEGDSLATVFIIDNLTEAGTVPMGQAGTYLQKFKIKLQVRHSEDTRLSFGKSSYKPSELAYPTRYSANARAKGKVISPVFSLRDERIIIQNPRQIKRKIALVELSSVKELYESNGVDFKKFTTEDLITELESAGVKAVIFTTNKMTGIPVPERYFETLRKKSIPIWFVASDLSQKLTKKRIRLITELFENEVTTNNIVGLIETGSPYTIAIGAHYDHLGMGDKNSIYRGKPAIHHGADDNASGVAGALALARYLNEYGPRKFNYLIMLYGAEEQGLLGSKYWVSNPTYPIENIVAMFNLDMIGRLGDDKTLKINGTGTSPTWDAFFRKFRCYDFRYQFSKGGRGPSDHTSFYNQNIPVLHFFTGLHADYHKPTDVAAKINFQGVREIVALCATLVEELNTMDSPPLFTPTDDAEESRPLRFNVTMGIMPGYNNDDSGLEVEGVTKGKPAEKAGITKGDIIVKIGERQIRNIRDYMEALSLYDKGDSTPVQIIRSGKQLEVTVHFE